MCARVKVEDTVHLATDKTWRRRRKTNLKPVRPIAKLQEIRKPETITEFSRSGKHLEISYAQFPRGWGHSGIQRPRCVAQVDAESGPEQGVQLILPPLGRKHIKIIQRHLDRRNQLALVGTSLEGREQKLKGPTTEKHIKSHLEKWPAHTGRAKGRHFYK